MKRLAAARVALAVGYPLLAHWASHAGGARAAALALFDLALIVLLGPLAARRAWAWALLAVLGAGLAWATRGSVLPVLLLAPPVLFTAAIAWVFARTLRPGQVPLVTRLAGAIEYGSVAAMPARQQRYTRNLTVIWAGLLAGVAVANGTLALLAEPGGLLARLGHPLGLGVSQQAWSWFANVLDYGLIGGFFVVEFAVRLWLFPEMPVRRFSDFLRRMARLGPEFWKHLPD